MDLSDRIYNLFLEKGFDIKNDCHALTEAVNDMIKRGVIPDTNNIKSKRKIIEDHVCGNVTSIRYDWIKYYCDYFKCSSDYLLGFMEKDITKFQEKTGLSDKAVRRLITNKDYQFVINSLLEKNGINYIVEALQADSFYSTQNNFIASHLYKTDNDGKITEKEKNLRGVSIDDLEIFRSNLDSGYKDLQEKFAIVCFDKLRKDKSLSDYFFNQSSKRFSDQLEEDLKEVKDYLDSKIQM